MLESNLFIAKASVYIVRRI